MPSLKIGDRYSIKKKNWVITNLWQRTGAKKGRLHLDPVEEVDLEDVPPPRKDLHQNRYGLCERNGEEMFLKILSPGFYRRAKKYHEVLKPYAKNLFVKSYFDDSNRILAQPKLQSVKGTLLKEDFVKSNVRKINQFVRAVLETEDEGIIKCFRYLDVARDNFMLDEERENFYLVDFDPWTHLNDDSVWTDIIKELSDDL